SRMRLVRVFVRLALLVCLLGIVHTAAIAQTTNATLHGTIVDTGGGVLPGVAVKISSLATGLSREAITNGAGVYVFNFLPAGEYVVTAELTGFKAVRQPDIKLEVGESRSLDLKTEVGRVEEVVTVEGIAAHLDRTSAAISSVIQASHLRELPLAGRHCSGLILLDPGGIKTHGGHTQAPTS